jgi:L-ascorbate metabolism protein UlaG (beta-lactamase superfamily)
LRAINRLQIEGGALIAEEFTGTLAEQLTKPEDGLSLYWLGQAGFVLTTANWRLLIDPYLSDSLGRKYAGKALTHVRLMEAPIRPEDFSGLDFVLCTHRHGDHMDPDTIRRLAERHPECRFVVPAPERDYALTLGISPDRLLAAIPEVQITLAADLTLLPLPAAHEEFKQDVLGHDHFLGFMLSAAGYQIYHSGDSIPFAGLEDRLRKLDCELALLPVNGRDAFRKSQGIPGNFTLEEAIALCRQAEIRTMVAHHFGMFDFNTVAPEAIDEAANKRGEVVQVIRARTSRRYLLRSRKEI